MLTIAMERANKFDRTIRARNVREILGALLLTAISPTGARLRCHRLIGVWRISSRPCCANTTARSAC
jgi:hypothetical protein